MIMSQNRASSPPVVFTDRDGKTTVTHFPAIMLISPELLNDTPGRSRPECLRCDGEFVEIRVSNGRAVYRKIDEHDEGFLFDAAVEFVRVYGEPVELLREAP